MPPKRRRKAPATHARKSTSTVLSVTKKDKDVSSASAASSESSSAGSLPELVKKISGKLGKPKSYKSKAAQPSEPPMKVRRRVSHTCGNGKLDANTCTLTELRKAGVADRIAKKIVQYRKTHKCFVHVNELMRINGMKPETFAFISKKLAVPANPEDINKTLARKRKNSKNPAAHTKSKATLAGHCSSRAGSVRQTFSRYAEDSCEEDDEPDGSRKGLSGVWPRGSASLSSVVTISPQARGSRSGHRPRNRSRSRSRSPHPSRRSRSLHRSISRSRSHSRSRYDKIPHHEDISQQRKELDGCLLM